MATTKIDFDQIETGLPTGGDVDYNNVELLLAGEGSNGSTSFLDDSKNGTSIGVNGTVSITTSVGKWGSSSINFQSGNSALTFAKNSAVTIGTEDFTLEAWVRPTSFTEGAGAYLMPIMGLGTWSSTNSRINYLFWYDHGTSTLVLASKPGDGYGAGSWMSHGATTTLSLNTWTHLACSRYNGTTYLFKNGSLLGTSSLFNNYNFSNFAPTGNAFFVGKKSGGGSYDQVLWPYRGYMNDIRITKGVARYTSDFSTPSFKFDAFRGNVGKPLVIGSEENVTLQ